MEGNVPAVNKVHINKERCKGCQLCIFECDKNVLIMTEERNESGLPVPAVKNMADCTGCCNCAVVCPECCLEVIKDK